MKLYPTAHIDAKPSDIAKTVLMPGDPQRSMFIAENFLTEAVLFNNIRGIQGYTGNYMGTKVSVMASGMGMPSMGIYSYELFNFFGVENIIRIGTAGSISEKVKVRDIVIGMGACTTSSFGEQFGFSGTYSNISDYTILRTCADEAEKMGAAYHVGNILSEDAFYNENPHKFDAWRNMNVLAVEMEAAALYMNAAKVGKRALAICTVSNHILTGEETTAEERRSSFTEMMTLALNTAKKL